MSWQVVKIEVPAAAVQDLGDALLALGALSVSVQDARAGTPKEQPIFDEPAADGTLPGPRLWPVCTLAALLPREHDAAHTLARAAAAVGLPAPSHRVESLAERDWVRHTQQLQAPIQVSPRLWVLHPWHRVPKTAPDAVHLWLDPGLAFGTGAHATTRMCLEWLDAEIKGGERVIDWGTGSGILAIAALRLGARHGVGIDLDPQALRAAADNAARNRVSVELRRDAPLGPVDLVAANIIARALVELAPAMARVVRPGGRIALTGILPEQAGEVAAAYSGAFALEPPRSREGWVLLVGRRI